MPGDKQALMQGGGIGGIQFDERDVTKLRRIKTISSITGVYAKPGSKIQANGKTEAAEIVAASEEIVPVMNLEVEYGRLFEKKDSQKGQKIILISTTMAEKLFDTSENVLGKKVDLNEQSFKIIGLLKPKSSGLGSNGVDNHVYIPFKASYSINPDKKFYGIYLKTENKEVNAETKTEIENVLLKRYDKDDFSVLEQKEIMDTVSSIFNIINSVLVAIAAISLIVGGIGIMNIMYVSVTERIKEIGIRRALGARKSDILYQFITESVLLSLLGGFLGLSFSFLIVFGIQKLFPAYIDLMSVALALGVSSGIGIIFGVFPAKKAADLSPIDAIRYE